MKHLEGKTSRSGESLCELYLLAHLVRTEIETRLIYRKNTAINIAEFFNICFPMVEGLRSALRQVKCAQTANSSLAESTEYAITNTLELLDKWHYSYTTWLRTITASESQVKKVFLQCEPHSYENVQTFCQHSVQITEDIKTLIEVLESTRNHAEATLASIRLTPVTGQPKSWWQRLLNK